MWLYHSKLIYTILHFYNLYILGLSHKRLPSFFYPHSRVNTQIKITASPVQWLNLILQLTRRQCLLSWLGTQPKQKAQQVQHQAALVLGSQHCKQRKTVYPLHLCSVISSTPVSLLSFDESFLASLHPLCLSYFVLLSIVQEGHF